MKTKDIIFTASSNMMRSKLRTALTIIAIFVGAFTISMTLGIGSGISKYIDEQLGNIGAEDGLFIQAKVNNPFEGSGPKKYNPEAPEKPQAAAYETPLLDSSDLEKLRSITQLKDVEPYTAALPTYAVGANQEKYQMDVTTFIDGMNLGLISGSSINNDTKEVLLPVKYVDPMGFKSAEDAVGKPITFGVKSGLNGQIKEVEAVIVGVQQETIVTSAGANISETLAKEMYDITTEGVPPTVKERYLVVISRIDPNMPTVELDNLKKELDAMGYAGVTVEDQIGLIKQVVDAVTYVLIFFGAIALLAASFGIINTLFMAVQERTKEIGLMKALGMGRRKIFLLFSVEAILIGFWGSLLGVIAAIGVGRLANRAAANSFLKDLKGFELTSFPLANIVGVVLLISLVAFLAGTLPARRASRLDPIEALRYE